MAATKTETALSRSEWRSTPYAGTTAKDSEAQVGKILQKYGVEDYRMINGNGPHGRRGFAVEFCLKGKTYAIGFERLEVRGVDEDLLIAQIRRAVFHHLKALLEAASVFVSAEEVLMPYLLLPSGHTLFRIFQPALERVNKEGIDALKALPAPQI